MHSGVNWPLPLQIYHFFEFEEIHLTRINAHAEAVAIYTSTSAYSILLLLMVVESEEKHQDFFFYCILEDFTAYMCVWCEALRKF